MEKATKATERSEALQQLHKHITDNPPKRLLTVDQFCSENPAFTTGGIRHAIFHKSQEIESVGGFVRFGRRLLIDEQAFLAWVRSGGAAKLAGKKGE